MTESERKIISDYVCAAEKPKAKGVTKHFDNTLFPVLLPLSGIFNLLWRDIRHTETATAFFNRPEDLSA